MKLYKDADRLSPVPASPEDIITAFNDLPLPVRMRPVVVAWRQADERLGGPAADACYAELLKLADRWEREDAEKAKEAAEVEELAQIIRSTTGRLGSWESIVESAREEYREQARAVLGAGYRKQADDE